MKPTETVIEVPPESQAIAVRENGAATHDRGISPAQAKVDAIASLTMTAYARASTLELSADEVKRLQADFPDEAFKPGAAGKEHLIYIEHAFLRDRFNEVLGIGRWSLIPRNRWAEPFTTERGKDGQRVYVEAMLLVRGAFVAEAVGAMEYYPHNASQDYSDAVEGAKTAAFRRCAKEFGVGLQAWKKDFGDGWWSRHRSGNTRPPTRPSNSSAGTPGPSTTQPPPKAQPRTAPVSEVKNTNPVATQKFKDRMIESLVDVPGEWQAKEYACAAGILLPTEGLADWPLRFVPATQEQFQQLMAHIEGFFAGDTVNRPAFVNNEPDPEPKTKTKAKPITVPRDENCDHNSPSAPWRSFKMPMGKCKGQTLAELDKKYLFGLWANYEVGDDPRYVAGNRKIREMLDEAGKHYEFTKEA